jgi:hypothetical protein
LRAVPPVTRTYPEIDPEIEISGKWYFRVKIVHMHEKILLSGLGISIIAGVGIRLSQRENTEDNSRSFIQEQ